MQVQMNDCLFFVEPEFPSLLPVSNDFEHRHPGINKMAHGVPSSLNHSLSAIPCLHGTGTSAAIFEAQTRNIRASLPPITDSSTSTRPTIPRLVQVSFLASRILVLFTAGSAMNHNLQLLEPPPQVLQASANTFQPHSHT